MYMYTVGHPLVKDLSKELAVTWGVLSEGVRTEARLEWLKRKKQIS